MRRMTLLVVSVVLAVGLFACSKSDNTSNSNSTTTTAEKSTSSNPTTSTASSSGDKIGIAECDEYIAKYESCVRSKVPEAMRAQLESALKTSRENWKKAAENTASRGTLAAACKQASDAAAASMKAYGCSF